MCTLINRVIHMRAFFILVAVLSSSPLVAASVFDDLAIPTNGIEQVRTQANKLIQAGFPNPDGGDLYVGAIKVFCTFDPKKDEMPFGGLNSDVQSTMPGNGLMEYGYTFNGPHFKTAEGLWILGLYYAAQKSETVRIEIKDAQKINLETFYADAQVAFPQDLAKNAADWVAVYPEDQREYLINIMNKSIPLSHMIRARADVVPLALLLLHGAGVAEAPLLAFGLADMRGRNYWQQQFWNLQPGPFDPSNQYPDMRKGEEKWHADKNGIYEPEQVEMAFRRSLFRGFMHMAIEGNSFLKTETAVALARLCLDKGDPQGLAAKLDAIVISTKINVDVDADASVREKITAWGKPQKPKMLVTSDSKNNSSTLSTSYMVPVESYIADVKDLAALFALVGDAQPSKYVDFQGVRSVGDNALRGIAQVFGANPLSFVEMEELVPWTVERRQMAADKLQKWWLLHKDDYQQFILPEDE